MATKKNTGVKAPKATEKKAPEQTATTEATERPQYKIPFISAKIDRLNDNPESKVKAFASITVGNHFAAHGFKVIENDNGELGVMNPSKRGTDGKYYDDFHAVSKEAREAVNGYILSAYEQKLEQTQSDGQADEHTEEELTDEDEEPAFEQTM